MLHLDKYILENYVLKFVLNIRTLQEKKLSTYSCLQIVFLLKYNLFHSIP